MVLNVLKNTLDYYSVSVALPLASLADIKPLFIDCLKHMRHKLRQDAQKTTLRIYWDMWQLVPPQLTPDVNNFLRCDNNFLVECDRFVSNVMPWVVKQLQGKRESEQRLQAAGVFTFFSCLLSPPLFLPFFSPVERGELMTGTRRTFHTERPKRPRRSARIAKQQRQKKTGNRRTTP